MFSFFNFFHHFFIKSTETLTITIKELYREDSGLRVFECEIINVENRTLAQANINVFQPKDPDAFIQESYA